MTLKTNLHTPLYKIVRMALFIEAVSLAALDVPDPPELLTTECKRISAILHWRPQGDTRVSEYHIQYNTSFDPETWRTFDFTRLSDTSVRVILSPWTNYTFRVVSRNSAGISNASAVSRMCTTEEDVPYKNPEGVYGRGNGPNNLVISWKPMSPIDHNAPGFYYQVYWRRDDVFGADWQFKIVRDWEMHKLVIEDLPKRKQFRIKVEAYNRLGKSKINAQEVIGYSDEDVPTEAPREFQLVKIRDGRTAQFVWDPVDPRTLNGHFKGYKIQVWIANKAGSLRETIVPPTENSYWVNNLYPDTNQDIQIRAYNGAFDGPPSDIINVTTPFDIYPDAPDFQWLRLFDREDKAVLRLTILPNTTNGNPGKSVFVQYRIKEQEEKWTDTYAESIEEPIHNSELFGLELDTVYEVRVVARSGKLDTTSAIVEIDTKKNPPTTTTTTTTTTPTTVVTQDFEPITDLFPDIIHDHSDGRSEADEDRDMINPHRDDSEEQKSLATTPWFIALIIILIAICLLASIAVFLHLKKRNRSDSAKRHIKNSSKPTGAVAGTRYQNANQSEPEDEEAHVGTERHPPVSGNNNHSSRPVYNSTTQPIS